MMILIYIVLIVGLACNSAPAQDVWWANATYGNDANDGSGPNQAEQTLAAVRGDAATGDTIVIRGNFGSEDYNLFLAQEGCPTFDSLAYVNKIWKYVTTPANQDTLALDWGSVIDRILGANGDDYEYWGIHIDGQDGTAPIVDNGQKDGHIFYYCKLEWSGSFGTRVWEFEVDNATIKYCIIKGASTSKLLDIYQQADNYDIQFNTFYATGGQLEVVEISDATVASPSGTFKNNLIYVDFDASASSYITHEEPDESLVDCNNNIYWGTNSDPSNELGFEWDGGSNISFSAWKDSLQTGVKGIDPDGDDNSFNADPSLNENSGYCALRAGSIAIGAASDGTSNIGFFQMPLATQTDGEKHQMRRRGLRRTAN